MGENDELVFQPVDKGTLGDIRRMFVPCRMSNATEDINQRFIKYVSAPLQDAVPVLSDRPPSPPCPFAGAMQTDAHGCALRA